MLGMPVARVWEMAFHLAVAGDVSDGVLFCSVHFPTGCLGWDLVLRNENALQLFC